MAGSFGLPDFSKIGEGIDKLEKHFERIASTQEETRDLLREIRDILKEDKDNAR